MGPYRQQIRVYYGDTDATGVVYHANYLTYAERGRVDALHDRRASALRLLREHGMVFLVRRASIEYRRPLRLDEVFELRTGLVSLGGASARLRHDFVVGTDRAASVSVELASVRADGLRPARIPLEWRAALEGLGGGTERPDGGPGWEG